MAKKAMLGHKLRRLRRDRGLTQAALAERLGISASYLNLIERNQRPVTIDLLLKIGRLFDLDLQSFAEDDAARLSAALGEVFGDPLFEGEDIRRQDLIDFAEASPAAAQAVVNLYRAYRDAATARPVEDPAGTLAPAGAALALERVRDALQAAGNHFPALEEAAEALSADAGLGSRVALPALAAHLDQHYGTRVRIMPAEVMAGVLRRYDTHGRRILLNEMLPPPARLFQLLAQFALVHHRALIVRLLADARLDGEAADLGGLALAHYFAGAAMMPYDAVYRAATAARYDIDVVAARFDVGFEQACHRLTTLGRPGARGVPFFLVKVDRAGNVAKRLSAGGMQLPSFGGACPRWVLHDAFRTPGRTRVQLAEMPDGARFLAVARTVEGPGLGHGEPPRLHALMLGCDAAHAAQTVYADGLALAVDAAATPIGPHCRACDRLDCADRAHPPAGHRLAVDLNQRGALPFGYEPAPATR
ncbi:MAG: short-chain fatty acyl-CoA regulator family protein [Alphaproteobacteria bacterium]